MEANGPARRVDARGSEGRASGLAGSARRLIGRKAQFFRFVVLLIAWAVIAVFGIFPAWRSRAETATETGPGGLRPDSERLDTPLPSHVAASPPAN